jgi:hypothetical protein
MINYENIIIDTVVMLIKFIIAFCLFYIYIPSKLIKFDDSHSKFLDKVFISLVHSNMIIIILVHLLAFTKIYETFSIAFCYLMISILIYKFVKTPGGLRNRLVDKGLIILDKLDDYKGITPMLRDRMLLYCENIKNAGIKPAKDFFTKPFSGILVFGVLAVAAYIRFHHSIVNLYYGASDCYVHAEWVKFLGSNKIYEGGIYPNGYHAVISGLNKLSFIDPYYIIRFIGPFEGVLIVLSIYYMVSRLYKDKPIIAWTAMAIYIAGLTLPLDVWRQISALPQEYAAIFLLPGLYFFNNFINTRKKHFLILTAECFSLTLLIHPYITVFMAIGLFIIFIVNINRMLNIKLLITTFTAAFIAGIVGVLPLLMGYVLGMKFHGSLGYIEKSAQIPEGTSIKNVANIATFYESNSTLLLAMGCAAVLIALWFINIFIKTDQDKLNNIKSDIIIILNTITLYLFYRAKELHLPVLMDTNRIGIFLSLFAAIAIALTVTYIFRMIRIKSLSYVLKISVFICTIFYLTKYSNFTPPVGLQYQYNEVLYGYLKVKKESFPLDWTIISPVEEYSQCYGYGWHYEIAQFTNELMDKNTTKIEMPTELVYLFVEKKVLNSDIEVSEDYAKKDLPKDLISSSDIYLDKESRAIIESKAYYWVKDFIKRNKNAGIVFENNNVQIYKIKQDKDDLMNFKHD